MIRVTIEFITPAVDFVGGGFWNPGERAGFAPEIAEDFIARGVARRVEAAKAPVSPPRDKMMADPPAKKEPTLTKK